VVLASNSSIYFYHSCIAQAHRTRASTASLRSHSRVSLSSFPLNPSTSASCLSASIFGPSTSLHNHPPSLLSQYLLFSLSSSPGGLNAEACHPELSRDAAGGSTLLSRGREKGSASVILGCLVLDGINLGVAGICIRIVVRIWLYVEALYPRSVKEKCGGIQRNA